MDSSEADPGGSCLRIADQGYLGNACLPGCLPQRFRAELQDRLPGEVQRGPPAAKALWPPERSAVGPSAIRTFVKPFVNRSEAHA